LKDKILHTISILLVFVFLAPTLVKIADTFTHEHHHVYCLSKTEKHLHKEIKECAVAVFTVSTFLKDEATFSFITPNKKHETYPNLYQPCSSKLPFSTYLLRAPPILIS